MNLAVGLGSGGGTPRLPSASGASPTVSPQLLWLATPDASPVIPQHFQWNPHVLPFVPVALQSTQLPMYVPAIRIYDYLEDMNVAFHL